MDVWMYVHEEELEAEMVDTDVLRDEGVLSVDKRM